LSDKISWKNQVFGWKKLFPWKNPQKKNKSSTESVQDKFAST
jgi:hypothetical protein